MRLCQRWCCSRCSWWWLWWWWRWRRRCCYWRPDFDPICAQPLSALFYLSSCSNKSTDRPIVYVFVFLFVFAFVFVFVFAFVFVFVFVLVFLFVIVVLQKHRHTNTDFTCKLFQLSTCCLSMISQYYLLKPTNQAVITKLPLSKYRKYKYCKSKSFFVGELFFRFPQYFDSGFVVFHYCPHNALLLANDLSPHTTRKGET